MPVAPHFIWFAFLILIAGSVLMPRNALAEGHVLLELFTSQSCDSCPPADAVLKELDATNLNIVALEFHVDYWDTLVWGNAGSWKDLFSQTTFTQRQRRYNLAGLSGRNGVYTPQLVINGEVAAIGSKKRQIQQWLEKNKGTDFQIHWSEKNGELTAQLDHEKDIESEVWLARFIRHASTRVPAGENKGKTLKNHHIVTELRHLAPASADAVSIKKPENQNEGCAIFIQSKIQGPIVTAAYCPIN